MSREVEIACLGYSVKADVYEGSSDRVVLMLIGFTSSKSKYVRFAESINEQLGSTVVVLDYSGHGVSPFEIENVTSAENFLETVKTFDWINQEFHPKKISVLGTSYGGFMASELAKYRSFDEIIMRVPALYEPDNFYTKWEDSDIDARHEYRLSAKNLSEHPLFQGANQFDGRALVVLHEHDDMCPPNSTQPFIDAFDADSWVWPGIGHSLGEANLTVEAEQAYYDKIIDWMQK